MLTLAEAIRAAARARAGGASWPAVAAEVGRSVRTVRAWPRRYPERWSAAAAAAHRDALNEAQAEAVAYLRKHMRNDDAKLSIQSAKAVFDRLSRNAIRQGEDAPATPEDLLRLLNADAAGHLDEAVRNTLEGCRKGDSCRPA